jgi:hypothetical protein
MATFDERRDLLSRMPDERTVDRALRGARLDALDRDGRFFLGEMAWEGASKAVAYLLKRGADVDRRGGLYLRGTALGHAMAGTASSPKAKVQVVKILLAAGADPSAKTGSPAGTVLDYALAQAAAQAAVGKDYDADSQRHAKSMLQGYRETIPLVIAAGGTMSEASRRLLAKLVPKAEVVKPFDPKKARALLRKADRDAVYDLCGLLAAPTAVGHSDWAAMVKGAIDAGRPFRDVAKEVYGKPVSFLDDEGWLCQGWDNYVVLDLVFELLAQEGAIRHPKWADLVAHGLEQRRRFDATSFTEDAVAELLAKAKTHPAQRRLKALEKKTR